MMLLMHLTLSLSYCIPAFLVTSNPLDILIVFLSFKQTGVTHTVRHLKVNLLMSASYSTGRYVILHQPSSAKPFVTDVTLCTSNIAIFGKFNFCKYKIFPQT